MKIRVTLLRNKKRNVMRTRHRSIENKPAVTSQTRRFIIDEDLVVPGDLVIEILRRLPVKSVARFLLVSKLWLTIIRSRNFIKSFPLLSLSQPRRGLFGLSNFDPQERHSWTFYLETEDDKPLISPLSHTQPQILPNLSFCDVHYVNGLISRGFGQKQLITNPSTGKSITLPQVKTRKGSIQSFFGYDPIHCQYKVLCMSGRVFGYSNIITSSEHQVFTLGEQSWRLIECNTPHCPKTNGVCINGVLYYAAFAGKGMMEWCLMRFDVKTEKLNLFSWLNENNIKSFRPEHSPYLINYLGKVTLACETSLHTFDLWVMEDEKWSKIRISIDPWMRLFVYDTLRIRGTIHTGEIVFVPFGQISTHRVVSQKGSNGVANGQVVYYDHKRGTFRLRTVRFDLGNQESSSSVMVLFSNYVESAMLL